jgi:hypothetical protein
LAYIVLLRVIHITAAAVWTGAAVMFAGFATPAVRAMGPDGGKFMQRLIQARFPQFMILLSWLATVSGVLLYWQVSGAMQNAWITSPPGLGFTVGAIVGILAFLTGAVVSGPAAGRLGAISRQLQAGGPPTPAQASEIQALQERLRKGGLLGTILLVVALMVMSVARYLR